MALSDSRDGFLFLGNHLSLDFLNTRPVIDGAPVELLPDGVSLARWLAAAELIPTSAVARLAREWRTASVESLCEFRESFLFKALLLK